MVGRLQDGIGADMDLCGVVCSISVAHSSMRPKPGPTPGAVRPPWTWSAGTEAITKELLDTIRAGRNDPAR